MNGFSFTTAASPDRVWAALTDPALTARYLHGLAATSAWQPGAPVTFHLAGAPPLTGEVLAAEARRRLSYTVVAAGDDQPATYVTWEIWADGAGAAVRLYVDDPDRPLSAGPDQEAVAVWSDVVAALAGILAGAGDGSGPPHREQGLRHTP